MNTSTCLRLLRLCAFFVLSLATTVSFAQEHRYSVDVGGGYSPPVGRISNRFNPGWNATAGGGVNLGRFFNLGGRFMYNSFGVSQSLLSLAGTPGGDAHVWALTAEPRFQLGSIGRVAPYIVGGVGYYHETINFTQPALFTTTFFDPYFGILYPGVVRGSQILQSVTHGGIGGSLGAGFTIGLGSSGMKLFTEARYHYANTGPTPLRMIPVTIGLRF